ncbi:unnamed protein product, partial [Meganyctiphanes norvegica]
FSKRGIRRKRRQILHPAHVYDTACEINSQNQLQDQNSSSSVSSPTEQELDINIAVMAALQEWYQILHQKAQLGNESVYRKPKKILDFDLLQVMGQGNYPNQNMIIFNIIRENIPRFLDLHT